MASSLNPPFCPPAPVVEVPAAARPEPIVPGPFGSVLGAVLPLASEREEGVIVR